LFSIVVRNATVISGKGIPPFTADIGLVASRRVQIADGRRELQTSWTIEDLGDLRTMGALRTIDAAGMTAIPLVDEAIAAGQVVDLPEWKAVAATTIAVGQTARIAILKPAVEPGKFVVEAVLR
jgi:hypothetical protein